MEMPPPTVITSHSVSQNVPLYLDEIGKCQATEVVAITPQVGGSITKIHFTDGQELKKGDPLFTIDPRPYVAALDAAKADLAQNRATLDWSELELERVQGLIGSKAISQSDYDQKRNAAEVARARVKAAESSIEVAKLNLEYCEILSPIDGRASARTVDVGNVVRANEGTLLNIQRLDPIYADFTITEKDLTSVRDNMKNGTLKVLVRLPGETGDGRAGDLTFLDNTVKENSGTVRLRATVENKDRHFWPGQFVQVRLVLSEIKDAVLVDNRAMQISQQGPYVYVVKPDADAKKPPIAELRPVTLGQRQGERVVIQHGISAGEEVIITGQMMVIPSMPVTVQPPTTQPSTQPAPTTGASKA